MVPPWYGPIKRVQLKKVKEKSPNTKNIDIIYYILFQQKYT